MTPTLFLPGAFGDARLLSAIAGVEVPVRAGSREGLAERCLPSGLPVLSRGAGSVRGVEVSDPGAELLAALDHFHAAHGVRRSAAGLYLHDGATGARAASADLLRAAAAELRALRPHAEPERIAPFITQVYMRADSALRAQHAPTPGQGASPARQDVEAMEDGRPFAGYFAVARGRLRFPKYDGGMSAPVTREAFLASDAVTLLPYDPVRDRVLVIEQFRFGPYMRGDPNPWLLEPVAGRIDPGEDAGTTARRETMEEAGIEVGAVFEVGRYYPSPGALTEWLVSYVGIADLPDGVTGTGGLDSEAEDILSRVMPLDVLLAAVDSGVAATAPLILSAQWLALNRARIAPGG